jgi:hypothetical protein
METINDRPPVVTIINVSPNPALTGQLVTIGFSATDPDGTVSSISVNWGDGSAIDSLSGTATSDTHTYSTANSFTITVTATDNSGSTGFATAKETITSVSVTPVNLTFQALAPQSPDRGAGQLQVFVNGQHVVDITPGLTSFVSFGPIDITSFVIQGQNNVTFMNPQTNQFSLVKNVTIIQGNAVLLHVPNSHKVSPSASVTFTFSLPSLVLTSFTVSNGSPLVGQDVTFTATFTGGTAPFKCLFRFGDRGSSSVHGRNGSCSITVDYHRAGSFTVTVRVTGHATSDVVKGSLAINVEPTTQASHQDNRHEDNEDHDDD